jgi:hypothetical protein
MWEAQEYATFSGHFFLAPPSLLRVKGGKWIMVFLLITNVPHCVRKFAYVKTNTSQTSHPSCSDFGSITHVIMIHSHTATGICDHTHKLFPFAHAYFVNLQTNLPYRIYT